MKFLFESEDCIVGIIVGLVMVGLSGRYFQLPNIPLLWGFVFTISLAFTIFDVIHTFSDLGGHPLLIVLLLINNAIDFILEAALAAMYFGMTLPFFSLLNPYLSNPAVLYAAGIFFIISSIFWIIVFPFV